MYVLKNALITRGGDIERAKKFVAVYDLPSNTRGLYGLRGQLYTFGWEVTPGGGPMPLGVQYQQLAAPGAPAMTRMRDVKGFNGFNYAIAEYDDGNLYHFYNGSRVAAWDGLADAAFDYSTVAARLAALLNATIYVNATSFGAYVRVTAKTPGTAFTLVTVVSDVDGDLSAPTCTKTSIQANVAAVAEVRAAATVTVTGGTANPGVNRITALTIDGVPVITNPVNWIGSNDDTANALAVEINNTTGTGYTASAAGSVVTLRAQAGTGATVNGDVVAATTTGDMIVAKTDVAGGVTAVAPVAQVDQLLISATTPDSTDLWGATLNGAGYYTTGRASATGTSAYVHKSRVYSLAGSLEYYCKINDATNWTDATVSSGAGKINIANETEGSETLVGQINYADMTAIFSRTNVTLFHLNADAATNSIDTTVGNTGTIALRSLVEFGASDVYYFDESGIRSLQTRAAVDAPFASDVGSAIDPFVKDLITEVGTAQAALSCAAVEAGDGRYFLALGRYLVVLSYFPASKITAWSYIDFGTTIGDLVRVGRQLYLRAGNTVYLYGGTSGTEYPDEDEFPILAETPFISSKDPAGIKQLEGFDMAAVNTWHVEIMVDPMDTSKVVDAGYINGTTYHLSAHKIPGHTSHYGLRMTCSAAGFASLSSVAVHNYLDQRQ